MKKLSLLLIIMCLVGFGASAQTNKSRENKKNLTVKEWNLKTGSKTPFLDHVTTYDASGRKVEETEYASYGQKWRKVYQYENATTRCTREIEYNDKNKVVRIRKYEYNSDGTKKKQFNYTPNGKLESTKTYERFISEQ